MIDLKDLKYLHMVSKMGAINKAAKRLGITQPALTRRIQRLEGQFDLQLLDRQPKGVRLTQVGENFLNSSQKLLAHTKDFEEEMTRLKRGKGGLIRVGIKPGLDDAFFQRSLIQFREKFPETVIRISIDATPNLMRFLRNGELDLAFGAMGYADDFGNEITLSQELAFDPIMEIPLTVFVRADHPMLSATDPETALFNYPVVAPSPPLIIVNALKEGFRNAGQSYATPQVLVDDFHMAAKIVRDSDMWSAAFEPNIKTINRLGEFVFLGNHAALPPLSIGIVKRKTWAMSPWANNLLTIVKEVANPWLI